jgi:hypothetical protein
MDPEPKAISAGRMPTGTWPTSRSDCGSISATAFPSTVSPPSDPFRPITKIEIAIAAAATPALRGGGTGCVRSQRGKVLGERVDLELEDPFRPVEVLQALLAQIAQAHVLGQLVLDQFTRRVREQHLAAVSRSHDPGRAMNTKSDITPFTDRGLARMKSDPDAQLGPGRPLMRRERPLSRDCRRDRVAGPREGHEKGVALRVDLLSVRVLERLTKKPLMLLQYVPVTVAERPEQSG